MKLIDISTAAKLALLSKPSYYRLASQGLFPKAFKVAPNRSGVFQEDVEEIIKARAGGASDSRIKELVTRLGDKRKEYSSEKEGRHEY